MSKHIRLFAALTLCLVMTLTASVSLAAPSLKLTVPGKEVGGGTSFAVTLTASEPGFATITLLQGGSVVATMADNKEIHTKENEVTLLAVDDQGEAIAPGSYTMTAVMVDQFGVSSGEVSKEIKFKVSDIPVQQASSDEETKEETKTEAKIETKSQASSSSDRDSVKVDSIQYVRGEGKMGDEGYEIGVGVSDAAATAKGYWTLTSESTDEEIWAAIQTPMTAVNVDDNENAYIYDSVEEGRKRLGTVAGASQGLNVIAEVGNWSLVEAFRVEDGAFVRGYIRTNKLRTVEPNETYGLVIDKATQTLTVYKDGARIGSTPVSTGLPTTKYLHRETPAGEFVTATRRGTIEYYGTNGFSKCTIRVCGSYHLSEIPTTKKGGSDYSMLEGTLGQKATRGNICIANEASADGGINAEWIWNMTDENKRVKVLILDDKDRASVPVGE